MRIFFYLGTCSTCTKIMNQLNISNSFTLREIKSEPLTEEEVDRMAELAGSYAAIFSKRAMKYRALGLHEKDLSEQEMRNWILKEYTFLKRPVAIVDNDIFVGNAKSNIAQLQERLGA